MLNTNFLKINIKPYEVNQFFLTAEDDDEYLIPPSEWKTLLFNRHEESYFGTFVDEKDMGVLVDGWYLVTLLAMEQFNRMIEWDWDDTGQICLAAAQPIYEAIKEGDFR